LDEGVDLGTAYDAANGLRDEMALIAAGTQITLGRPDPTRNRETSRRRNAGPRVPRTPTARPSTAPMGLVDLSLFVA